MYPVGSPSITDGTDNGIWGAPIITKTLLYLWSVLVVCWMLWDMLDLGYNPRRSNSTIKKPRSIFAAKEPWYGRKIPQKNSRAYHSSNVQHVPATCLLDLSTWKLFCGMCFAEQGSSTSASLTGMCLALESPWAATRLLCMRMAFEWPTASTWLFAVCMTLEWPTAPTQLSAMWLTFESATAATWRYGWW